MAKIRYTKNELKRQKDDLKRFTRYLPTLELKKMQLIQEIRKIQDRVEELRALRDRLEAQIRAWVDVFGETVDWPSLFRFRQILTGEGNIAGIDIPLYEGVVFEDHPYDLFTTPLWVDRGIEAIKEQIRCWAELQVAERQRQIIEEELRITIQRIKLFEEVKIPEARENIRVIQIFMGDQQTAAVVRGKIAKTKIGRSRQEAGPV
ncbi:MAG: V-type ATP synthase subunit D [Candidatus Latescibacterota bacterium]